MVFFAYANLFVILMSCILSKIPDLHKEMAKIDYTNPNYLEKFSIFTIKKDDFSSYLTNCSGTLLVPFGNNVTVHVTYKSLTDEEEHEPIMEDLCKILQWKWVKVWVQNFSDIPIGVCPIPPRVYHFYSIDFPSKNVPYRLSEGEYNMVKIEVFVKATKEEICTVFVVLRHDEQNTTKYKPVEILGQHRYRSQKFVTRLAPPEEDVPAEKPCISS